MANIKNKSEADQHWENRILCSDESCIGVIGPDGRCKECGKTYAGDISRLRISDEAPARPDDIEPVETEPIESAVDSLKPAKTQPDNPTPENDWESRTLCSDESCIGVIGPDGRCKECGKPFKA